jgi:hypothetical protein
LRFRLGKRTANVAFLKLAWLEARDFDGRQCAAEFACLYRPQKRQNTMAALLLGLAIWVLFAAAAWRYSTYHPTLHPFDRMGAAVFFLVVGLPFFGASLALISNSIGGK